MTAELHKTVKKNFVSKNDENDALVAVKVIPPVRNYNSIFGCKRGFSTGEVVSCVVSLAGTFFYSKTIQPSLLSNNSIS